MAATMWGPTSDPPGAGAGYAGTRAELLRTLPDADLIREIRDAVAEADSAQAWYRNRVDHWRRWHNEHYTAQDRSNARQQWVSGGAGAPDQLAPAEPLLIDTAINGIAEEFVEKYRETGLEVRFVPRSRSTPSENVAVMNGILRRIDADGGAAAIEINAFREALLYGYACLAYEVAYAVEDMDPRADADVSVHDLILKPREIERAEWTVLWDPACKRLDKSDARWCAIRTWMTRDEFIRQYPNAASAGSAAGTIGSGGGMPNVWPRVTEDLAGGDAWYVHRGGEDLIQVVDFYRRKPGKPETETNEAGQLLLAAPEPEPEMGPRGMRSTPPVEAVGGPERPAAGPRALRKAQDPRGKHRRIDTFTVEHITACGDFILDRTEMPGNVIPVVPIYGHRMVSETEGVWHHGLVYMLGDALKASENISSQATGVIGRSAKASFLVPQGGTDADEEAWATLHVVNRNFLPYSTTPPGGPNSQQPPLPAPTPLPSQVDIGGQMQLLQHFQEQVARRSGTLDLPATQDSAHDRSAQSIVRLNAIGQARNELYARNMATITLRRKGQILARMIPAVYSRRGRVQWVKGADPGDKDRPVILREPFIEGDDDAGPVVVADWDGDPENIPVEWSPPDAQPGPEGEPAPPKKVHYIDLRKGTLDAETHIGSREKASRQEAVNTLATLLGQEGSLPEAGKAVAGAQMVAILSADLPELLPVYRVLRQTVSALHPDDDMGRDAVMARLTEAQAESAQKDQEIARLTAEADKLRAVRDVANIQAGSSIEREAIKGRDALVMEGLKQEGKAREVEAKSGAALELAALKAAFDERMARLEGSITMLVEGFKAGSSAGEAEARAADVKTAGGSDG